MASPADLTPAISPKDVTDVPPAAAQDFAEKIADDAPKRRVSDCTELRVKAQTTRAGFKRPAFWVLAFGWSLALCAGLVNVLAKLSWNTYVSHATGGTTSIGLRLEGFHRGHMTEEPLLDAIAVIVSFIFGAFLCGLLIDKNQVHFGGKALYGVALIGNSALLVLAVLVKTGTLAACLAATACGLQNAMCTSHFGAVVRTTHVTGTITDIGSTTGRMALIFLRKGCRRSRLNVLERAEIAVDARKLLVLGPMWCCFLLGCIIGAYVGTSLSEPVYGLLIPASITFAFGLGYTFFRHRFKAYFQKVMKARLSHDLEDVETGITRAKDRLRTLKNIRGGVTPGDRDDDAAAGLDDIDSEIDMILESIHQVEVDIDDLRSNAGESGDVERGISGERH